MLFLAAEIIDRKSAVPVSEGRADDYAINVGKVAHESEELHLSCSLPPEAPLHQTRGHAYEPDQDSGWIQA